MKLAARSKKGRKKLRETNKTQKVVTSHKLNSDESMPLSSSRVPQYFEDSVLAK